MKFAQAGISQVQNNLKCVRLAIAMQETGW